MTLSSPYIIYFREIKMKKENKFFTTQKLVAVAMFSALAYVIAAACSYLPKVGGFLSLDIKDAIIVLCSLIFGPLSGLVIAVIVPVLELVTGFSTTAWYGLIMNILSSFTFCLVTGLIYKFNRSFKGAIIALLSGVFAVTAVMMLANLFITPLYLTYYVGVPTTIKDVAAMIPTILLPFNFLKATLNGALVLLLYKQLSSSLKGSRLSGYDLPDGEKSKKLSVRSIIVTAVALVVIIASVCIVFFVL